MRASATSPSLVPFLPYVLRLLFANFFFFLSKPAPTSCKPNSLLMPTIKIMNCDGRTPSNEGTSGVLSPPSHTAGDFRALHSSQPFLGGLFCRPPPLFMQRLRGSRRGHSFTVIEFIILFSPARPDHLQQTSC